MSSIATLIRTAVIGFALLAGPQLASAQEISPEHLAIALDAVRSAKATQSFDNVLPNLAAQVEDRLIHLRPDLHKQITASVEDAALKLAIRRADLDNDIARVWAKTFTDDELKTLATFYKSPAGQKFGEVGPQLYGQTMTAVNAWSDRLGAELLDNSKAELKSAGVDF